MKFAEAYEIAMNECEFIKRAMARVQECIMLNIPSPCYLFSIGDEVFYFGFNGADVLKGKHTHKRSRQLIDADSVWRVRN